MYSAGFLEVGPDRVRRRCALRSPPQLRSSWPFRCIIPVGPSRRPDWGHCNRAREGPRVAAPFWRRGTRSREAPHWPVGTDHVVLCRHDRQVGRFRSSTNTTPFAREVVGRGGIRLGQCRGSPPAFKRLRGRRKPSAQPCWRPWPRRSVVGPRTPDEEFVEHDPGRLREDSSTRCWRRAVRMGSV